MEIKINKMDGGRVFVFCSKYHGSNRQLEGLAKQGFPNKNILLCSVELRSRRKFLYPLYRFFTIFFKFLRPVLPSFCHVIESIFIRSSIEGGMSEGDVIIAKTAPYEAPLALMASGSGAKSVFVGEPRRFSARFFDCIVSTPSTPAKDFDVFLPTLPTSFSEFDLRRKYPARNKNVFSLFVGGDARGYKYGNDDWSRLLDWMIACSTSEKVVWRVATSPRTPVAFVDMLSAKKELYPNAFSLVSIFGSDSEMSMLDCLGESACAVVSEDSASMVSECVNVRIPVLVLAPEYCEGSGITKPQVECFERAGAVFRQPIEKVDLARFEKWCQDEFLPISRSWREVWCDYLFSWGQKG